MEPTLSVAVETWVQLTANELYADFCNHGGGHNVLARALRLGYLRCREESQPTFDAAGVEARIRARAERDEGQQGHAEP